MVTTVTTSVIAIVATSSVMVGIAIFASLLLISFLSARELLRADGGVRQKLIARSLMVGIIPLLIGFLITIALKVAEILG